MTADETSSGDMPDENLDQILAAVNRELLAHVEAVADPTAVLAAIMARSMPAMPAHQGDLTGAELLSVLIVEDNVVTAWQLARCVSENRSFRLAGVAATEQEAIDMARRVCPDLVLLDSDLSAPRTGFDVWHALHKLDKIPDVIVVTGIQEIGTVPEARRHGAFDYVVKPFTPSMMNAKLTRFAAHRRQNSTREGARLARIDRLFRAQRGEDHPSGLKPETLERIIAVLQEADRPLRISETAERVGVERGTANRCLIYLCEQGIVDRALEHGHRGHPAYLYTLARHWRPEP